MINKIYFGEFTNLNDVIITFGIDPSLVAGVNIIYAAYDFADYDGWAHIIYIKDGVLYEVNDSHCSCNGLENWEPEETSALAILSRPSVRDEAKLNIKEFYKNLMCFL